MTRLEEESVMTIDIPVSGGIFYDVKEVTELFNFVYEGSVLNKNHHFPNTFFKVFECSDDVYKFKVVMRKCEGQMYNNIKAELIDLVSDWNSMQNSYRIFRKFGDIESKMYMRKPRI